MLPAPTPLVISSMSICYIPSCCGDRGKLHSCVACAGRTYPQNNRGRQEPCPVAHTVPRARHCSSCHKSAKTRKGVAGVGGRGGGELGKRRYSCMPCTMRTTQHASTLTRTAVPLNECGVVNTHETNRHFRLLVGSVLLTK